MRFIPRAAPPVASVAAGFTPAPTYCAKNGSNKFSAKKHDPTSPHNTTTPITTSPAMRSVRALESCGAAVGGGTLIRRSLPQAALAAAWAAFSTAS